MMNQALRKEYWFFRSGSSPLVAVFSAAFCLVFLFGSLNAAEAKPKHKNKHKSYAHEDCFVPPGLRKQGKVPPGLAKQGKTPPGWSKKCKSGHGHGDYGEVKIKVPHQSSPCKNLVDLIPQDKKLKNIAVGTVAGAAVGGAVGAGTGDPIMGTVFGAAMGGVIGAVAGDHNDSGKSNIKAKHRGDC